ncbi:hypothetical protein [Salicibibacter kimchii]|uniref:Uncharacterized protein n=1 Tax=Salicibibacter kimchii TaxID=2099786 RepID=A0A345BWF2_9BACI|nr:hypothetical protein [Salicibibacter kimchii]AXF55283.1 hypothetical protein DT065_04105 [Salicibibacter kimchii]
MDEFEWFEFIESIEKKTDLPRDYCFLRDKPQSSSYKDPYLGKQRGKKESETEQEATEQIFLFDRDGTYTELSQASDIINTIRNGKITSNKLYVPEELLPYIEEKLK